MKSALAIAVLSLSGISAVSSAGPIFTLAELGADERLLFLCTAEQPGWADFNTLFEADLAAGDTLRALTHFPERSRFFPDTGDLEIQNRFGLFRVPADGNGEAENLPVIPSFTRGDEIPQGRILPVSSSPDGRWILVQEPAGAVRGRLVIYKSTGGPGRVLSSDHVLDYRNAPGVWSPDSRYLLYSRAGILYYVAAHYLDDEQLQDESYRTFGKGNLSNIRWTGPESLHYLRDSTISLVRPSEFFTRSFYLDPLPAGVTSGRIPIRFDNQSDIFWPAPDGSSVIILKSGVNLFKFPLTEDSDGNAASLPFLLLPEDVTVQQLWWQKGGDILVLTGGSRRSSSNTRLYKLSSQSPENDRFLDTGIRGIRRFAPSPDRRSLAVLHENGFSILNPDTMEELLSFSHTDPRDVFWIDSNNLLVTGGVTSELFSLETGERRIVALSAADRAGFDSEGHILAASGGSVYRTGEHSIFRLQPLSTTADDEFDTISRSAGYRAYLENLTSAPYRNIIRIRTVDGFGNRSLFPVPQTGSDHDSLNGNTISDDNGDIRVLNHGSRTGYREVALVFNVPESSEGLGEILNVLADYNLQVTFFVGGDFIRRHPDSAKMLALSGHELGSLFYTHMDMADFRYRIDKEFVIRGLGRNEDEFFRTTGSEVSTIWHAPWYVVSPSILDATEEMGYQYIGRDVDPLDWVVSDGPYSTRELYRSSPELVEMTLKLTKTGSIIPVRVGKPGTRGDYFFRSLELLINGLLADGYDIVTIGELRERTK